VSSRCTADNHQGGGLRPCHGVELNICAGNWIKKPNGKAKEGLAACCHPSDAFFLQHPRRASHSAEMLSFRCGLRPRLRGLPHGTLLLCWSPRSWRSSASQRRSSLGFSRPRVTCPAEHQGFISITLSLVKFCIPVQIALDFCQFIFQGSSATKAQNIYWKQSLLEEMLFWMKPVYLENILNAKCCLTVKRCLFCHSLVRNVVNTSIWNSTHPWCNNYWGGWGNSHISFDLFRICEKIRPAPAPRWSCWWVLVLVKSSTQGPLPTLFFQLPSQILHAHPSSFREGCHTQEAPNHMRYLVYSSIQQTFIGMLTSFFGGWFA